MVVSLVLEHQQPPLDCAINIYVYEYAAGVIFLADFHVVQLASLAEMLRADRGHVHEVQPLLLASKILAHLQVQLHRALDILLYERIFDSDFLKLGRERGVAAVVAPVSVQDAQLCLVRVAAFLREIFHDLVQVIGVHRKAHFFAIGLAFGSR